MAFCKKCGAYIPIDETACPACGYDPEAEAREAEEAKKRAEEEERRRQEEDRLRRQEEERRRRQEEARRREEERRKQGYYSSGTQSQYASQHTGQSTAYQSQYASQHAGQTWVPPWQQQQQQNAYQSQNYAHMQNQARESVDKQKLSILSYLGPLWFIPLIARNDDDFARFHTKQGLAQMIFSGLLSVVFGGEIATLASLFFTIKGISNVLKGKKEPLPIIGKIFGKNF